MPCMPCAIAAATATITAAPMVRMRIRVDFIWISLLTCVDLLWFSWIVGSFFGGSGRQPEHPHLCRYEHRSRKYEVKSRSRGVKFCKGGKTLLAFGLWLLAKSQ